MSNVLFSLTTQASIGLSPRLQHAIQLLQLSSIEFEQALQNALTSNPFLEESEADEADEGEAALPTDANDATCSYEAPYPDRDGRVIERGTRDIADWLAEPEDFRAHLHAQLDAAPLHPRDRAIAGLVIETLDDDGYLRDDVMAVAQQLHFDPPLDAAELDVAIALVQKLDPVGVGARDVCECLQLQLRVSDAPTSDRELASTILDHYLELLGRRDFAAIGRRTDRDEFAVARACKLLRRLDPRPGHRHSAATAQYVVPDVIVVNRDGRLQALSNPALRPRAQLNRHYIELFRGQRRSARHPAMTQQLQEARWLLKNAEQRFATIERVANEVLRRQAAFFVHGDLAMRPMTLREIADELSLHESTISRATSNKYIATPAGLFELKYFFSRELPSRSGSCSPASIRAVLREIIDAEDQTQPLSDVRLADLLRQQGIRVARRTVSKYRSMMRVPPADLRRAQ
ncbi:RNA polymerase factor sigma-54 [Solimonas marina]|uniref:RNA polymerase sigma-54 factor n=1 Tax=Solimonas marina TaxID=2714601 RepID=A0A969WBH1_9GAMM|nr:RNA polymerase factor sigma-54 [Solimonas marina]NKF23474.1 RNA polymerase factor sigma-54 [Solimonas marina]